ncbi:MAG: hypothetical protein IKZ41_05205 [Clostridia bacterium]|nr:hypothetical protein [Clostridia bacterium]MBR5366970.1 hypothetical protein [Clostridia bacterium]
MNAPNREKIMKALACHADTSKGCAEECQYIKVRTPGVLCSEALARDALKLIETLIEENKGMRLLIEWAEECDFGYDNIPEEYEKYKGIVENMGYIEGLIYIGIQEAKEAADA